MTFAELENMLKETIGLDSSTIGSGAIHRAVKDRMKTIGSNSVEGYWNTVCTSPEELQELVEAVVIPETWFFRDAPAFTALTKFVWDEWRSKNSNGILRVLSLPCSTGEEPYSLAIALRDCGVQFQVDAIDISHRSLSRAKKGIFGRNSFRGGDLGFRDTYFTKKGNVFELNGGIRCCVNFEQGNVLEENFGSGRSKYDFIFCRNLLIYFDAATQRRAFAAIKALLKDEGALFVGPSEGAAAANHGFSSAKIPMAFAFRKAESKTAVLDSKPKEKLTRTTPVVFKSAPRPEKPRVVPAPVQVVAPRAAEVELNLDSALESADAGKLEQASQICHAHIRKNGASAQAYYLLGLVQDASNCKEQAREFYRKALYLQPDHYDALMHLALLTASLGDANGARLLQARAERVKQLSK